MILRPATEADIAGITAIYAEAVLNGTASFELDPPDEAEMARRWQAVIEVGGPYLVAHDSEVLGYAYAAPYRPRPAYRFAVECSVYVSPRAQGKLVGTGLLLEVIRQSEEAGFRQMVAVIGDSANTPSIKLHSRAGFTLVGTLKDVGWKHGGWRDTVIMQRPLGPGATKAPA